MVKGLLGWKEKYQRGHRRVNRARQRSENGGCSLNSEKGSDPNGTIGPCYISETFMGKQKFPTLFPMLFSLDIVEPIYNYLTSDVPDLVVSL